MKINLNLFTPPPPPPPPPPPKKKKYGVENGYLNIFSFTLGPS